MVADTGLEPRIVAAGRTGNTTVGSAVVVGRVACYSSCSGMLRVVTKIWSIGIFEE